MGVSRPTISSLSIVTIDDYSVVPSPLVRLTALPLKWLALAWVMAASIWQLVIPLQLGLSNNGDYSKVSGYYKLAPVQGWGIHESEYYLPDYEFNDRHLYRSNLTSSEHLFAWPAVKLSRLLYGKHRFLLLAVAMVKLVWYWGASAAILFALQAYWPALVLAALLLSDASLLTYLPGFYMDSAALLFALSLAGSLLWYPRGKPLAIVSALGLILSKSQHAPLAFIFAAALLLMAWRCKQKRFALMALLFLIPGVGMLRETTAQYAAVPVFTLTFYRIAPTGDRMGLPSEYDKYIGMHAYSEGSPIEDPSWSKEFLKHVSLSKIAYWYATHPGQAIRILGQEWWKHAGVQPDPGLGWHKPGRGEPARSQAGGMKVWSAIRGVTTYVGFLSLLVMRRRPLLYLFAVAAGTEFAVSTLADTLETARHLYLFQIFADLLAVLAVLSFGLREQERKGLRG